jgi:hypothetical protein
MLGIAQPGAPTPTRGMTTEEMLGGGGGTSAMIDAPVSLGRGFNRGLFSPYELLYRGTRGALGVIGADGLMRPYEDTEAAALAAYLTRGHAATTAGRYAEAVGEAAGSAAPIMVGGMVAAPIRAASAATNPAASTAGRIVDDIATHMTRAPGTALATDAAGIVGSGVAMRAADDMGAGTTGRTLAGIAGGLGPSMYVSSRLARSPGGTRDPLGGEDAVSLARTREAAATADAAAFRDLDIRPFGPAFNQGPVASVGRQLTETPFVGAPLRNNLDETYRGMADAAETTARSFSPTGTAETAGAAAQRGLDRFARDGLSRLEASTVEGLGIPSRAAVPRPSIMSAGAADDAALAAPIRAAIGADTTTTTRGAVVPAARPLDQTLTTRTTTEMLSDAQIARLIRTPAHETSLATRAEALYERAWRMIPGMMRANNTANPNLVNPTNTRQALGMIEGALANDISGQRVINGALAERLGNARANITLADLRSIRTEIGRAMSGGNPLQQSLDRSQLRSLYAATSRDIEIALETLANRAAIRTELGGNRADRVSVETARSAAGALRAFRTADRYFRMSTERMDRFASVLGAQSPEQAAQRITHAAMAGDRGNIRMFRTAMAGLRAEERAEFGSMVVRSLGAPVPSARGTVQEVGFSAQSFMTRWNRMAPEARDLLFTPEHRRALDNLARVANRIANVEALANTSRSGTNVINVSGTVGAAGSMMQGDFATPVALGVSGLAASVLMSRPAYTTWMTRYIQLRAAVRDGRDTAIRPLIHHVISMESSARGNPELLPVYAELLQDLTGKNR